MSHIHTPTLPQHHHPSTPQPNRPRSHLPHPPPLLRRVVWGTLVEEDKGEQEQDPGEVVRWRIRCSLTPASVPLPLSNLLIHTQRCLAHIASASGNGCSRAPPPQGSILLGANVCQIRSPRLKVTGILSWRSPKANIGRTKVPRQGRPGPARRRLRAGIRWTRACCDDAIMLRHSVAPTIMTPGVRLPYAQCQLRQHSQTTHLLYLYSNRKQLQFYETNRSADLASEQKCIMLV